MMISRSARRRRRQAPLELRVLGRAALQRRRARPRVGLLIFGRHELLALLLRTGGGGCWSRGPLRRADRFALWRGDVAATVPTAPARRRRGSQGAAAGSPGSRDQWMGAAAPRRARISPRADALSLRRVDATDLVLPLRRRRRGGVSAGHEWYGCWPLVAKISTSDGRSRAA